MPYRDISTLLGKIVQLVCKSHYPSQSFGTIHIEEQEVSTNQSPWFSLKSPIKSSIKQLHTCDHRHLWQTSKCSSIKKWSSNHMHQPDSYTKNDAGVISQLFPTLWWSKHPLSQRPPFFTTTTSSPHLHFRAAKVRSNFPARRLCSKVPNSWRMGKSPRLF